MITSSSPLVRRRRRGGRFAKAALRLVAPVAAAPMLATLVASPASAAIDPTRYRHVAVTIPFQADSKAGGYVSCPTGTKAIAAGAISSDPASSLMSGLTTFDGNGSFVTVLGRPGASVRATLQCVRSGQLKGSTLVTETIRDHRGVAAHYVEQVTCPAGMRAYGGGGFVNAPGLPPDGGLLTYASMPTADGTGWVYAGYGSLAPDLELTLSTHCLPAGRFGSTVTVSDTDSAPTALATLSPAARCPTGFFAYAGGAYYHAAGSTQPRFDGSLSASAMTADDRGWYAQGLSPAPTVQLTATAQCMAATPAG